MNVTLARLMGTAFGDSADWSPRPADVCVPAAARRRKKLWELPTRWHCPLIGTCLPVSQMRKLAARAGFDAADMSDYSLHTIVVAQCDKRSPLSEDIQRWLDKRHGVVLRRFEQAASAAEVLFVWREILNGGDDIAGALWAAWTHAQLEEDDGKEIYGDLHMLSHQVGASARADLEELDRLRRMNVRLREEAEALRLGFEMAKREKAVAHEELRRRLVDAEQRAALLPYREMELAEARKAAGNQRQVLERAEALAMRAERLEERNAEQAQRIETLAGELNASQESLAAAESALEAALGICGGVGGESGCGRTCPAEAALAGRCVLCIGGRTGLIDGYRRLVETQGGRFAHHDGGQEESLHRIDAAIAAADAVVCQSGCISHSAYWRLKEACKKLGKPCVFVQSPGVGSFARGLAVLGGQTPPSGHVTLLAH